MADFGSEVALMTLNVSVGTELAGRFVVSAELGMGGSGVVWKATDRTMQRDVAIKRLLRKGISSSTAQLEEVLAEARKHALVVHTNVVQIYDVIEVEGEHLIVMECVNGLSLLELFRGLALRGEVLPLDRSMAILRDTLAGLSYAHAQNLVHRDIGPANILLSSTDVPKIADFGIARILREADPPAGQVPSQQGGTGNPQFMAPEQAAGELADFGSDLFMLGIVGYLLLTGRHPFAHSSGLFSISDLIARADFTPEPPRASSGMSAVQERLFRECAAVVMRLLQKEKAARFQSAREAMDALERIEPSIDCPGCGERIPDHSAFCSFCGAPQGDGAKESAGTGVVDVDELIASGFTASKNRDWSSAIDKYSAALAIEPENAKALRNLGFALNYAGEYERADAVVSKGLEQLGLQSHHRASLLLERGLARTSLKQYALALSDLNESLHWRPGSLKALYSRARVKLLMGMGDEAKSDAQAVLKREPTHSGALRVIQQLTPVATQFGAPEIRESGVR